MKLTDKRIIVPLSGKQVDREMCDRLIPALATTIWGFKLHPSTVIRLFRTEKYDVLEACTAAETRIFIDFKGFDIPTEVANMIWDYEQSAPIDMFSVHASGGSKMLGHAMGARSKAAIFAVTILTSMEPDDVSLIYGDGVEDVRSTKIKDLAQLAYDCRADGTVSSAADLALFEKFKVGGHDGGMHRCTPGIRLAGKTIEDDDQDRVLTPAKAKQAGSDLIVVGRPILQASDPVAAAAAIQEEFAAA